MKKIFISIPAFNEEKTIGTLIEEIKKVMDGAKYRYEINVTDDGSTDNTKNIVEKFGARIVRHPYNYGLAETFRTEIKSFIDSDCDIMVHIDADLQYLPSDIPKLVGPIEKCEADLVLGDRFSGGIEYMPLIKRLGNNAFSKVISKIIRHKINDCQTGFRAFNKELAKSVTITSNHTYTQEQIIRAVKEKFRVKEVPVKFLKRDYGKSKLLKNPFEYAIKAWINILRIYRDYEPLKFFGIFGSVFLSVGILIGIYLTYLYFATGKVGRMPLTILTMLLIITGVQIILFGFFADMQKK